MSYYNGYNGYNQYPQYPAASPYGGYPPAMPPSVPVNTYPGLPQTYPTPYQYPQQEACPSTQPYPVPPQSTYQQYPQASPYQQPGNAFDPSANPVAAPGQYGKRKALLIGINYIGNSSAQLDGCINDTNYLKYMLISKFKFEESNMLVLTDDKTDPQSRPTRENILKAFRWLVGDAQPGDSLWFSFSGHGGQTKDLDGDELDGLDETILPVDYRSEGPIIDDDIHGIMAMGVPNGAKLTCVMDCCHSGTGMDLPFEYGTGSQAYDAREAKKITKGDVICFSGCRDDQTSADAMLSRVAHSGVLTYSFVKAVESHHPYLTYATLLNTMQVACKEKHFSQVIQLSSGKALDLTHPFTM